MKIGIQGIRASFHDMAARKFFSGKEIEFKECLSFSTLFSALNHCEIDLAVMAIENALAGSILPNYSLLEKYGFKIIGEVFLKIELSLLGLPGVKLDEIKVITSHPMALLQCGEFFNTLHSVQLVEHSDTAESAREIKEKKLFHTASVASSFAAEVYGLNILKSNIETDPSNYTRFLILCRENDYTFSALANKSSIRFETEHRSGCLAKVLNLLDEFGINMSKIHSLPIIGKPYHYAFHADLEWSDFDVYEKAMIELKTHTLNLTRFGEYPAGEKVLL